VKKKLVLVACPSFREFVMRGRDKGCKLLDGKFETKDAIYKYIANERGLRGHHGIKFEIWGAAPSWILKDEANFLIKKAECE
jgi:hypothetical protein